MTSTSSERPKRAAARRRLGEEERRAQILQATILVVSRHGFEEAAANKTHRDEFNALNQITRSLRAPDGTPAFSLADYEDIYQAYETLFRRGQAEQLRDAASWPDRFALAEAALAQRLEAGRAVAPEVAFGWQQMLASRGQARVEDLAAEAGWSRKRLWSQFRSQIGLSPKRAAQLVRFDHAAHRLAAGQSPALVAAHSGYADQSHLHREVMAFAGMTPTAVASAPWLTVDPVAWAAPGYLSRT